MAPLLLIAQAERTSSTILPPTVFFFSFVSA
jgi:hypothetical protein